MGKRTKFFKIILTFFTLSFTIWFGSEIVRTMLSYDLFVPGSEFVLKPNYSNEVRMYNVYSYATTSIYSSISYIVAAISAIILAINTRKELKNRGWLFMSFLLFAITIPIKLYLIYLDTELAYHIYHIGVTDFFAPIIQENFVTKLADAKYTSMNSITMLIAITCVLYAVWRPLDKTDT